jgi:hypothetical protein
MGVYAAAEVTGAAIVTEATVVRVVHLRQSALTASTSNFPLIT